MNTNQILGIRISSERKRLSMSQEHLSEKVSITQKTQSAIETGKNSPSILYLYELSLLGFDTQFIITGVRSKNLDDVMSELKNTPQDSKDLAIAMLENVIALIREI